MKRYTTPTPEERRRVANAVRSAIRSGRLIKQTVCSKCKSDFRVEAHHDDYNYPLRVRWLCMCCHVDFHRRRHALQGTKTGRKPGALNARVKKEKRPVNQVLDTILGV